MEGYKNLHIILNVDDYMKIRQLGYELNRPLASLAREAISSLLVKYDRKARSEAS